MSALNPSAKANESCSGGCCQAVATSTQERSPDEFNDAYPSRIICEESADELHRSGCYRGANEENIEHGRVTAKNETEDCTSGCCNRSTTPPFENYGDIVTATEQCNSDRRDGSTSDKNKAAENVSANLKLARCDSYSAKQAPAKAECMKDDCGDDCCCAKPASSATEKRKAREYGGGSFGGPAESQIKKAPVNACDDAGCSKFTELHRRAAPLGSNDRCCGPVKVEPADECNDGCCGAPKPNKGQEPTSKVKIVNNHQRLTS